MKKVVIIVSRDKFTEGYISGFEKYFGGKYDFLFYTQNMGGEYPLTEHKYPVIELEYMRDAFKEPHIDELLSADAVVISGFFFNPPKHIKNEEELFDKMWIQFWGGDYTCFRPDHIQDGLYMYLERYKRRIKFVRRCRGWIISMKGEEKEISLWSLIKKNSIVAPVMSVEDSEERELFITKASREGETLRIILGNSSSRENKHIQILKRLSHLKNENIQIICPLSYPDNENAQKVKRYGEAVWGDKFVPLMDFIPKDEYFKMLQEVDVAIYNNNRQQAIGNIEEMLRQGKKVYLRKTTPMWKWYIGRGENIYSTSELRFVSKDRLAFFPVELAKQNLEIDREIRKTKLASNQWKKVLETVIDN